MIDFASFSDELIKIASSEFKPLSAKDGAVQVRATLPIIRRLSKNPERARQSIERTLARDDLPSVLGYKNVVVPASRMPDLASMGFRPTRIATPLPGERLLSTSYRAGTLHAHKIGPAFFIHQDKHAPTNKRGSYLNLRAVKHAISEGVPSLRKRFKEREALIRGVEK